MSTDLSMPREPGSVLAQKLRTLRSDLGWSLDVASKNSGVSKAMLGQIERGESSPTIATLWKIVTGFGVPLSELIEPALPLPENGLLVRKAASIRQQPGPDGMLVAPLFPFERALGFEVFELTLLAAYERRSEPHERGTIEHIIVVRGSVDVLVDGQWLALNEGEAVRFAADRPHGYRNTEAAPAVVHNIIRYARTPTDIPMLMPAG